MKHLKYLSVILLVLSISSCSPKFGDKYVVKNLEIYFTSQNVGNHYVVAMADYFRANDLLLDKPHTVQLTSDQEGFILNMVLDSDYKTLPAHQNNNLNLLEADIKEQVFDGLNFRIQVCNANFVPIEPAE